MQTKGSKNDDTENLRLYYQHASDELRFYKQQIMSLTNYVVLLNGALIYLYDRYNIYPCVLIILSLVLCVASIIFICHTLKTMEYMRNVQEYISKDFNGKFKGVASKNASFKLSNCKTVVPPKNSKIFEIIYYGIHVIMPIITIMIIICMKCRYL